MEHSPSGVQPILTLDQAREVVRRSSLLSLEALTELFKDAPDCVDVSGSQTVHTVTKRDASPNAFVQVPAGTAVSVTWPKLPR